MTLIIKIHIEIWFVFFSQDQHLFLNLFVTLNESDIRKYVQKRHLLTDMRKKNRCNGLEFKKELIITYIITGTPFILHIFF